jgi:polar amino acid transport system substrate-binding protein
MKRVAVFALLAFAMPAFAGPLQLNTEDYPPFNFSKDGKVTGITTEIVQEVLKRAGIQANFQLLPWERAIGGAEKEADTCVYSTIRSEKRESLFKWVGPIAADEWRLYARADNAAIGKLNSLDDAKKYKIGGYQGDALTQYLLDRKIPVEVVAQNKLNIPKLQAGRIDLWISTAQQADGLAMREGGVKVKPVLTFGEPRNFQFWLACNKGVGDDVIKKLNDAVASVHKDGTAEKITQKYR